MCETCPLLLCTCIPNCLGESEPAGCSRQSDRRICMEGAPSGTRRAKERAKKLEPTQGLEGTTDRTHSCAFSPQTSRLRIPDSSDRRSSGASNVISILCFVVPCHVVSTPPAEAFSRRRTRFALDEGLRFCVPPPPLPRTRFHVILGPWFLFALFVFDFIPSLPQNLCLTFQHTPRPGVTRPACPSSPRNPDFQVARTSLLRQSFLLFLLREQPLRG